MAPGRRPTGTLAAPACMLYIDWCDRRGDERVWVGIADSIGADLGRPLWRAQRLACARRSGHHGGRSRPIRRLAVYTHGGQPGTIWDMFGVKASEAATTEQLVRQPVRHCRQRVHGRQGHQGRSHRGHAARTTTACSSLLTGDLGTGNIGPYVPTRGTMTSACSRTSPTASPGPRGRGAETSGSRGTGSRKDLTGPIEPPWGTFLQTYFGAGHEIGRLPRFVRQHERHRRPDSLRLRLTSTATCTAFPTRVSSTTTCWCPPGTSVPRWRLGTRTRRWGRIPRGPRSTGRARCRARWSTRW